MSDDQNLNIKLNEIWRTCNKIRAASFRTGLNLWKYFLPLDPNNNNLISEAKFINILTNKVQGEVGISNEEIAELTDYFRVQDGRIFYHQFCSVIHGNVQDNSKNPDFVSGLEWEDPLQVNRLSVSENRRLCVLLTKISQTVRLREFVLRPYFQDYELISKNNGCVTLTHFSRVLYFLKITLSSDDYQLLLKRFMKDSYTINYLAFIEEIEKIVQYLDTHRMIDHSQDIINNHPGRLIDAELPKLPRPEIGKVRVADIFGKETSFHPCLKANKKTKSINDILLRIRKFVLEYQLRVFEFFNDFDLHRSGYITKSQFLRGLDSILHSKQRRLYLSDKELDDICFMFADELDHSRINWKRFQNDIDEVFVIKHLEKKPYEIVIVPPTEVVDLKREGNEVWQEQTDAIRNLCDEAILKVRSKISKYRLFLEATFKMYDRYNNSHVTRTQMRQVLSTNGILLSDEEMYALERRYNDDLGFDYRWFLNEADPQEYAIPRYELMQEHMLLINKEKDKPEPTVWEKDICQVLGKVKGQVVRNRIRILEFLKDYDRHNEQCILEIDFRRGLNTANIKLSIPEVDLLCDVFKSPLRKGYIDHKRFCNIIEESFYQKYLERAPLLVPLEHFPSEDQPFNFLNFDERTCVSKALQKLARKPDQISNLSSIFDDFDRYKCGTLGKNQFLRGLTARDLNTTISSHEFDVICKCFAVERGLRKEVDYRRFLHVLDVLFANKTNYPF